MFEYLNWIPAITTTSLFGLILWILRKWFSERLSSSIKHDYNKKLENIKNTFSQEIEILKFELEERKSELSSLKSSALANLTKRQALMFDKQVQSASRIWEARVNLGKGALVSELSSRINWDFVNENKTPDAGTQRICEEILKSFNVNDLSTIEVMKERPFVSPIVWAYYSAYQAIIVDAYLRVTLTSSGQSLSPIKTDFTSKLLQTTLPEFSASIKKHNTSLYPQLLDHISDKLLQEITNMLSGKEIDKATIESAHNINGLADKVRNNAAKKLPTGSRNS